MGGCSVYELSSGKNSHLSNAKPDETLDACALWTDARTNSLRLMLGGAATGEGRLCIWDQVGGSAALPSSFLLLVRPPPVFPSPLWHSRCMYAARGRPSAVAGGTRSLTRRARVVALAPQGPGQPAPRCTAEFKLPQSVCGCAWSSDGELALATGREFACVYYVDTEETAYRLPRARAEHTTWLCGVFHPEDSRWVALGGTHCYLEVVHRRLWRGARLGV